MKKALFSAFFIAVAAFADNVVIDLSSQPLSHEVEERKSKVGIDVGIGYLMSPFKAKQEAAGIDTTALMHGAEIFTNLNVHITERFGFSFGTGFEFVLGSFKEKFYECDYKETGSLVSYGYTGNYKRQPLYTYSSCSKKAQNWQLLNWYINTGIFADILKFEKVTVRAFGNVGFSLNWSLKNGKLDSLVHCQESGTTYVCLNAASGHTPMAQLVPISLGLRFIFADNHGVELVGKYYYGLDNYDFGTKGNKGKWTFKQNPAGVETQATRNFAFGLRYVYEFR